MTSEELSKALVKFIASRAERESRFLTPDPHYLIDAHEVLDELVRLTGISAEQVDEWCIEAREEP